MTPVASLLRMIWQGEGNLLALLPANAYRQMVGRLGYSRRGIVVVNDPALVRRVLIDEQGIFPKNDLMVSALAPLVGDSIFVSSGPQWRRQRAMIEPALSMMRVNKAYAAMQAAIDDYEVRLDTLASTGEAFSLDQAMSHLTADIICRSVFTTSLQSQMAREVFDAFAHFERSVAQVRPWQLIVQPAFAPVAQAPDVLQACELIRHHLGELVDSHRLDNDGRFNDIASAIIEARDAESGNPFTRKELIDQLGVFFLAGHETSASVLTWVFFILSVRPDLVRRMRREIEEVAGDGEITFEQIRELDFVRLVWRETLRLYPPITFLPRVALEKTTFGPLTVRRGTMVMVSPWIMHRHRQLWRNPDHFDPERFSPGREHELVSGAYLPFGLGPRVCAGASFATIEGSLIIARLIRRYDFGTIDATRVRPVARLTTRPARQIMIRVAAAGQAGG